MIGTLIANNKPVTAVAALRLVDQGVLDLDAPVNDALTSWRIPENGFTTDHPITLRQLLSRSIQFRNIQRRILLLLKHAAR